MRAIRKGRHLSLSLVAQTAGLSIGYVCDLEKGRKQWTDSLEAIYRGAVDKLAALDAKATRAAILAVQRKIATDFPQGIPSEVVKEEE